MKRVHYILTHYSFLIGLISRFILAWLLPYLFDGEGVVPGVRYTDIDYLVFEDAADYLRKGTGSPYDRITYRYTPFLAELLACFPRGTGRFLFCAADALCGWIIQRIRQSERPFPTDLSIIDSLWWMYNPLAINMCTRGSAESLVVLVPVLATLWVATLRPATSQWAACCGAIHGIAVHAKLYPVIYSLSYMVYYAPRPTTMHTSNKFTSIIPWIRCLLHIRPIVFVIAFVVSFGLTTAMAVHRHGILALQEGFLYHLSRLDHRHNYSMHWYWIYLARANTQFSIQWVGRLLLVPQMLLLVHSSLAVAPRHLPLALFVQTYMFVMNNKVITAQYFTWYLCLLPLCSTYFKLSRRIIIGLFLLGLSILVWLGTAYLLEMRGLPVHRLNWLASVMFYIANMNMLSALLASVDLRENRAYTGKKTM